MSFKIRKYLSCGLFLLLSIICLCILSATRHMTVEKADEVRVTYKCDICKSNIRRILFALMQYRNEHGRFPAPTIISDNGLKHSWRSAILPYLEVREYRMDEPWDSPWNYEIAQKVSSVFRCPHEHSDPKFITSYCMIVPNDLITDADEDILKKSPILIVEAYNTGIQLFSPNDIKLEQVFLGPRQLGNSEKAIQIGGVHKSLDGQEGCFFVGEKDGKIRMLSWANSPEQVLYYEP